VTSEPLGVWTGDELRLMLSILNQWKGYPFRKTGKPPGVASTEEVGALRNRILGERDRRRGDAPLDFEPPAVLQDEGSKRWWGRELARRAEFKANPPPPLVLSLAERGLLADLLDRFLTELNTHGPEWAAYELRAVMDAKLDHADALRRRLLA
jgi:hypothetical protein